MKVEVLEYEGCFSISISPETMAEAARLVRFGLNATKEVRSVDTIAYSDGTFSSHVVFGKRRNPLSGVR